MEKGEPEMRFFDTSDELSSGLADYVLQISDAAVKERGAFSLVLSGGSDLAQRLEKLTRSPFLRMVDWSKWYVFWADENVVAKRHPDSLYNQVKETFISKVPILPLHVISVTHGLPGDVAADRYEFCIRQQVRSRNVSVSPSSDCPRFDLVLLTLGSDGRIASLYPNHRLLEEQDRWVSWVSPDDAPRESVTITLPVINAAANVAIVALAIDLPHPLMVATEDGTVDIGSYPARMVSPKDGKLVWLVDDSAASLFRHGNGAATIADS